jgi:Fatty acid hydroxylase superfamily
MALRLSWYLATTLISHYVASFVQISLHYLVGHRTLGGPLNKRHVFEHHGIYSGSAVLSETYSDNEKDASVYYVVPAVLLVSLAYLVLPLDIFVVHVLALATSFSAHVYLHIQYHLSDPLLKRARWFQQKRRLHLLHHRDMGKNYAVIEFCWDKVFGTYQAVER